MAETELQPPTACHKCNSPNIEFIANTKVYGELKGRWPYIWHCLDCAALVGTHPGTDKPLGLMADRATRLLRKRCHIVFDQIWQSGLLSRCAAYAWLADELDLATSSCHIAQLTRSQLRFAIKVSTVYFNERQRIAERRKIKRDEKFARQREFEKQRIRLRKKRG